MSAPVGPYGIATPEHPRPLSRRPLWMLIVGPLVAGGWVLCTIVVLVIFPVASLRTGWLYAALCFLPGLVVGQVMIGIRYWRTTTVMNVVIALLFGWAAYALEEPGAGRIREVAEDVGVSVPGWRSTGSSTSGGVCCWQDPPEVLYYYHTDESPADATARFGGMLSRAGFVAGPGNRGPAKHLDYDDPLVSQEWHKGRWNVTFVVVAPATSQTPRVDPEQWTIIVQLDAHDRTE